jgi:dTDP-4-amino-4,6-dideoxygalactose transaminase
MIPFADLVTQHARLRAELEPAISDVLGRGEFVLGRRVAEFEEAFASYCGAQHGVGVNSGTSALHLALLAAGVGPQHEVITTAFSFVATAAAIGYTGARPVLVDVAQDSLTIDPDRIESAITPRTRAIVPVHLYGHPADMDPILEIARRHGLAVIEDAAQAHGAEYKGRRVGSLGDAGCFSFYPSKNLGACGDAGMVVTSHPDCARALRLLRDWGQAGPYRHVARGFNYRMASIQGAVLAVKLRHLDEWTRARRRNAARYAAAISDPGVEAPRVRPWARHVYHIYAVRTRQRAAVQVAFHRHGIETRVHYPTPIHLTDAWRDLGYRAGDFPTAERAATEVLSIPVHPELTEAQVDTVARAAAAIAASDWADAPTIPPAEVEAGALLGMGPRRS